jgi:hypothetical protein
MYVETLHLKGYASCCLNPKNPYVYVTPQLCEKERKDLLMKKKRLGICKEEKEVEEK